MYVTKSRSRPPTVVSAVQVVPLFDEVTRWPFAYGFEFEKPVVAQLHVYAIVPLANVAALRKMNAYRVPGRQRDGRGEGERLQPAGAAVVEAGDRRVARSAPLGTGVAPVVARIDSVMFGLVRGAAGAEELEVDPLELAGDRRSERLPGPARVRDAEAGRADVRVLASVLSGFAEHDVARARDEVAVRGTPRWNVLCELSVKQPLCAAR